MNRAPVYSEGLHETSQGCYAYLQPDGSWGLSNAGLIRGQDASLLVDTLFDLALTRKMLDRMASVVEASPIGTLVNTHANGDHCWGNQLVEGAEIIGSKACAEEMLELEPSMLAALATGEGLGAAGDYAKACFGRFDFAGIELTPPTRVFEGHLSLEVSGRRVELIEVGPAHTRGDLLVHVPSARTVYTGDILFIGGTPIVWAGPVSNWIKACDLMLAMDIEVVVPGHGPVTDKEGVGQVRDYLVFIEKEARARFEAGMSAADAARDIALGEFSGWGERERVAVNVDTVYRELAGDQAQEFDLMGLFALMAELRTAS